MNTPATNIPIPPDPSSGPATSTGQKAVATLPTLGGIVGSLGGAWLTSKMGYNPMDGAVGTYIFGGIAGAVTAIFHAVGAKIGVSLG